MTITEGTNITGNMTINNGFGYYTTTFTNSSHGRYLNITSFYDQGQTAGTDNWGLGINTANNYINGNLTVGGTRKPKESLDVIGNITASNEIKAKTFNITDGNGKAVLRFETLNNGNLQLGLALNNNSNTGYFSIMNQSNMGTANMSPSAVTKNPTLRIYSNATYSDRYMDLFHDADKARISWNNGGLLIQSETGANSVTVYDPLIATTITNSYYQCGLGGEANSFTCNLPIREHDDMYYMCIDTNYNFYQSATPCNGEPYEPPP
jgi:hypothetical protein